MENKVKKQFVAVRAVIVKEGKILIIKESKEYDTGTNNGYYDFPGGKVHIGEKVEDALRREVMEEIGVKIKPIKPFFVCDWEPTINGKKIQIIGVFYLCESSNFNIILGKDHDEFRWIKPQDYQNYPIIEEKKEVIRFLIKTELPRLGDFKKSKKCPSTCGRGLNKSSILHFHYLSRGKND